MPCFVLQKKFGNLSNFFWNFCDAKFGFATVLSKGVLRRTFIGKEERDMNTRKSLELGIVVLLAFGVCQDLVAQSEVFESSEDARIRTILDEQVAFVYDSTPFDEIVDELQSNYHIPVFLDRSARDDSLTGDELVTIEIGGISIGSGLRLILSQYNADFVVRDDVLMIISKDVMKQPEFFVQKIINCDTILKKLRAINKDREPLGEGEHNAEAELINTIKRCVAPDDWDTVNGDATVILVGNCIVVQSTEQAVKQVERLLVDLSAKLDEK